jgi:site-specific DNA-methyltransferase (adenine-specific)
MLKISLMQGDCLERMKEIPSGSVDMILCDLPYGTTACKWDSVIPFEPLWEQYRRIAKKNAAIVLTASQPFTSRLGASNLDLLKYTWVWEKSRPTNFLHAKRMPLKGFEDILVFYRKPPTYNPQGVAVVDRVVKNGGTKSRAGGKKLNGDVSFTGHMGQKGEGFAEHYKQTATGYPRGIVKFAQDANALHPTQKPVALMEYLIRTYTNEGETVLDNCMGSGTTGVACVRTGRNFIGIERDEGYFKIAEERIAKERDGLHD